MVNSSKCKEKFLRLLSDPANLYGKNIIDAYPNPNSYVDYNLLLPEQLLILNYAEPLFFSHELIMLHNHKHNDCGRKALHLFKLWLWLKYVKYKPLTQISAQQIIHELKNPATESGSSLIRNEYDTFKYWYSEYIRALMSELNINFYALSAKCGIKPVVLFKMLQWYWMPDKLQTLPEISLTCLALVTRISPAKLCKLASKLTREVDVYKRSLKIYKDKYNMIASRKHSIYNAHFDAYIEWRKLSDETKDKIQYTAEN